MEPVKFEEQFKNLISDIIMTYISDFNENRALPNVKIVIGGGSAINYYFKESEAEIFTTHDFDLRCVYDGFISLDQEAMITLQLRGQQMTFINNAIAHLNTFYYTQPDIFQDIATNIQQIVPDFTFVLTPANRLFFNIFENNPGSRLQTVNYSYRINGITYNASIIDLIVLSRNIAPHYGLNNRKDDNTEYTLDERFNMYTTDEGLGFIKNYIAASNLQDVTMIDAGNGIYYTSLGYLIWDTVRMLNWNARYRQPKYERYIQKYIKILAAFNNPRRYLRCDSIPMQQYIQNCLS